MTKAVRGARGTRGARAGWPVRGGRAVQGGRAFPRPGTRARALDDGPPLAPRPGHGPALRRAPPRARAARRRVRGSLDVPRAALWLGLAALLHAALHPVRTGARPGELRTWGLIRRHTVRTDRLVSLTETGGLVPRLLLRDTSGHRLSCETAVLTANPLLWHRLDTDLRTSHRLGLLRTGAELLERLEERVDREVLGEGFGDA
ncbi:hypothetical protein GA0115252_149013 [Streptomyces sp. DfronAA-171]|nr:hypothetical protein GA0115252_149013 [Streptomyces sp. DfronAA-171]